MIRRKIILIFFILACADLLAQSESTLPRLAAGEYAARLNRTKEPLPLEELVAASLVLSGVEENMLDPYRQKLMAKIADVKANFQGRGVSAVLADDLLQYMHKKFLKFYDVKQTRVDILLDNGRFNCVSSAVFYLVLCRSLGFTVYGVKTTDHSFVSLRIGDVSYDVETTSVFGFNPGAKKEFKDDFGKITGYAYVPPGHYSERQTIGEKTLLFLILHNRVVLLIADKLYSQALGLAVDGYEILQDDFALALLGQAFTQYGTWAVTARQFAPGLATIKKAIGIYKNLGKLKELQSYLILQWTLDKIEQGDYPGAEELITAEYKAGSVARENYEELMVYMYQKKAAYSAEHFGNKSALEVVALAMSVFAGDGRLLKMKILYTYNYIIELEARGEFDEAFAVLKESRTEGLFSDKDGKELTAFLFQKKAEQVFAGQGIWATLDMLQQGINEVEDKGLLLPLGEMYMFNYVKGLITAGNFDAALRALNGDYARVYLPAKSANDLLLYYYLSKAEVLARQQGYLRGAECIAEGITRLGRLPLLLNNYEVYIHNYVVVLVEAKENQKALDVLAVALAVLPKSSLLNKDKKAIESALDDR